MMGFFDPFCPCCRKRDNFAAVFPFSFFVPEKGKCPQNGGFQAYGLPGEPPVRQRAVPRQMLNLSQWRGLSHIIASCRGPNAPDGEAFSFFQSKARKCRRPLA